MLFSRIITCFFVWTTSICFGIFPNQLTVTPTAIFPDIKETECGIQSIYNPLLLTSSANEFFIHYSLSPRIRYGLHAFTDHSSNQIAHSATVLLADLFKESDMHVSYAAGVGLLSSDVQIQPAPIFYDLYLVQSWQPNILPVSVHLTLAREAHTNDPLYFASISYHQIWGTFHLEWDSGALSLGSQFTVNHRFRIRSGVKKELGSNELLFQYGISIIDTVPFFDSDKKDDTRIELLDSKPKTVQTSVALMHIQDGLNYYYDGQYLNAKKSYLIAQEFYPNSSIIFERLGSVYYKLGDYEQALFQWKKAREMTPSDHITDYIEMVQRKMETLPDPI